MVGRSAIGMEAIALPNGADDGRYSEACIAVRCVRTVRSAASRANLSDELIRGTRPTLTDNRRGN